MCYEYTYEMNLEYFAYCNENLSLEEDDLNRLFVFASKENYTKEKLVTMIDVAGFDFEIEEYKTFYKIY